MLFYTATGEVKTIKSNQCFNNKKNYRRYG